jgi:hypothetical protein
MRKSVPPTCHHCPALDLLSQVMWLAILEVLFTDLLSSFFLFGYKLKLYAWFGGLDCIL